MVFLALAKAASSNGSGGSLNRCSIGCTALGSCVCVAFQNLMAPAIRGGTLHSAGDLKCTSENGDGMLLHSEVDSLYIQNAHVRWVRVD